MDGSRDAHHPMGAAKRLSSIFDRREWITLGVAAPVFLLVHWIYFVPFVGEGDAADLFADAVRWFLTGRVSPEETQYRIRTSPLYEHMLVTALRSRARIGRLPHLMNYVNLVAGAAVALAAYLLFRRLVGRVAAAIACAFVVVSPILWQGASYAMPHVPALAAMLSAFLVFDLALEEPRLGPRCIALSGLSALLVFVGLSLKADMVLTGLAFPGLAWVRKKPVVPFAALGATVHLTGLAFQIVYVRSLVAAPRHGSAQTYTQFAQSFSSRFPFDLHAPLDPGRAGAVTHATGPWLFALAILSLLVHLVLGERRRLALVVVAWAFPTLCLWAFMSGNIARHNTGAVPPLALIAAVLVERLGEAGPRALLLGALTTAVAYVSDMNGETWGEGLRVPRTNLVQLAQDQVKFSRDGALWAEAYARLPAPKKALVLQGGWSRALLAIADRGQELGTVAYAPNNTDLVLTHRDGTRQVVRIDYSESRTAAKALVTDLESKGYAVTLREESHMKQ